jgi:hypothetical protein
VSDFDGPTLVLSKPLYAIRSWDVDRLGRLTGVSYPQVWTPGENVAVCGGGDKSRSRARPGIGHSMKNCTCGFYAYSSPGNSTPGEIKGVVSYAGDTVVGSLGVRTSRATIVALVDPTTRANPRWRSVWVELWRGRGVPQKMNGFRRYDKGPYIWLRVLAASFSLFLVGFVLATLFDNALVATLVIGGIIATALSGILTGITVGENWSHARRYVATGSIDERLPDWSDEETKRQRARFARIAALYPDARVFPSMAAAQRAFPIEPLETTLPELLPSPETDPEFWTRASN